MADAKRLIQESIKRVEIDENKAREADAVLKIAYYDFDKPLLKERLEQYIDRNETDIPYTFTNITQKVIDRKSMVYKQPPVRITGENEYPELTIDKDSSIKINERQTNLLGRTGFHVFWDEDKFGYNTLQYFVPIEVVNGKIISMMYPLNNDLKDRRLWVFWSPEHHMVVDGLGNPVKNQSKYGITRDDLSNPYDSIPFVFPYRKEPVGGIWVEGAGDVVNGNEQINVLLSTLNFLDRYASFKQPWIKGVGLKDQNIEFGYNKLVALETTGQDGSDLGVLDIQADLAQKVESIKFQVELLLHNNDLKIRFGGEGSATSGFQLIVENIDLLTFWGDMVPIWRKHERDIYEVEKMVYSEETSKSLPEKMVVDFAEISFPVSESEKQQKREWMLKNGLTSKLKILMEENPDRAKEDLQKELDEFAAEAPEPEVPPRQGLGDIVRGL